MECDKLVPSREDGGSLAMNALRLLVPVLVAAFVSTPLVVVGSLQGAAAGALPSGLTVQPPPPPSTPVRVGPGVKAPALLKKVNPVYPAIARRVRIQGVVVLEIMIGPDGTVSRAINVL